MDDIDKAYAELSALSEPMAPADLLEVGHFATTLVVARTKAGKDVDGQAFAEYSEAYAETRKKLGLSDSPDLAVTGTMLGALVPRVISADEVAIGYLDAQQEKKAAIHDSGSDAVTLVRSHSRKTVVDSKGRRVSREEAKRDRRRKRQRTSVRVETVDSHERQMHTPKREFADIRQPAELDLVEQIIVEKYSK